ncbi:MAG: AMP-dependent synthetase/ligase, partial [Deferrisomatales bacterium]
VATILFTSGTTGEPKGVVLTHRNLLSNVEAALEWFDIGPDDLCLAHLPLAHILERMAGYYLMLYCGATIAYAEDIKTVAQNIAEVRPTVAVSVPRIFEKIYAGIQSKATEASALVRRLTFWAIDVARRAGALLEADAPVPAALRLQYALADRLVYRKIRAKLGDRLRFFISGGAPLAPELGLFFNTIGVRVYEGYGLTETSPVISVNTPAHHRVGTTGWPLSNLEVRIAEDGEILVRGPSVFSGYHQNEQATREAFTGDGFFKTGDIGELTPDGFLRITDRKKDLIVTAAGKNVAPQKVENVLKLSKYVSEAMLYGDKRNFITALIVPDFEWLRRYAEWKGLADRPVAELVRAPQVLDHYARLIAEAQQKAELSSYETVKKFVLLDHEFSAGEGEVTPTLKIRRKNITARYQAELEALYAGGGTDG